MKFEDEFKKELNKISPTEEQCERIRSGVAKKLAESAPVKKKKPLYLRIAAVSGASICAAAVLIVVIFGMRGGNLLINNAERNDYTQAPSVNMEGTAGNDMSGANVNGDQNHSPKSDDVMSTSYSSSSSPSHNAQGDPSADGTSHVQNPSIGGTSGDTPMDSGDGKSSDTSKPASVGGGTDSGGTSSGSDTASGVVGGGDEPSPPTCGGGEGLEIPDGYVYLEFSKDNSICDVTIDGKSRTYRLTEDKDAPPFSEDTALKAVTQNALDFLVQFDEKKMFIYSISGILYNVYIII